jgi:hypothetical protein
MKQHAPQIRLISVDHDRTTIAETRLRRALDKHGMQAYPVRAVFCHLEAGRCGVKAGLVAIEVEGLIIWTGKELTEALADRFCEGLPVFMQKQKEKYGLA